MKPNRRRVTIHYAKAMAEEALREIGMSDIAHGPGDWRRERDLALLVVQLIERVERAESPLEVSKP